MVKNGKNRGSGGSPGSRTPFWTLPEGGPKWDPVFPTKSEKFLLRHCFGPGGQKSSKKRQKWLFWPFWTPWPLLCWSKRCSDRLFTLKTLWGWVKKIIFFFCDKTPLETTFLSKKAHLELYFGLLKKPLFSGFLTFLTFFFLTHFDQFWTPDGPDG